MFNHILICSDGSEPALAAQIAATTGQKCQSRITLLNVFDAQSAVPFALGAWDGASPPKLIRK